MTPCLKVTCLLFRVLLLWKWLIQTLYLDDSFCADFIAYMIAVSFQIMENVQAVRNPFSMVLFIGVQVELLNFVYLTQSTYMSKVPLMLWQPLGNHKVHGKSNIFKKFSLKLLSQSYLEFSYFEVYRKLPISIFLFIWWDFCVVVLLSQWCHGPLLY